jgi:hypothetical protein
MTRATETEEEFQVSKRFFVHYLESPGLKNKLVLTG